MTNIVNILYLVACFLIILSIRTLAVPRSARFGNILGMVGMLMAFVGAFISVNLPNFWVVISIIVVGGVVGVYAGLKVKIASLPQMIAVFNGFGGLAAVCIALSEVIDFSKNYFDNMIGLVIGGLAFSGSMVAFVKLQGFISGKSVHFPLQQALNLLLLMIVLVLGSSYIVTQDIGVFLVLGVLVLFLGVLLVLPVGGADMPVIISILNACSGWATVGIGMSLDIMLLVIVGSIVGAGGSILAYIMMKSMKRSFFNILTGNFINSNLLKDENVKMAQTGSPEEAAFIMENATKIIIVPGYGMAVAQAQYAVKAMTDLLQNKYGVEVKFAIHPVAGRMPGHMNVLLAEANVDYSEVFEMNDINNEFSSTDVVYVIGANDITNPEAKNNPQSPLYGMPVLDVEKAKTIFFVKRSLGVGYSGVENPLFYAPNTIMLYGDAKDVTEKIVKSLELN
ncbi:MAG: NAD(P)(+) transhydrogenase (Re/Si-specific) subunit beta [Alphaproteobacteria bacterium]|nr:NAD(P)(+) transhydrogenase (Re/Si-specific) subunit beta [Alphaproteobacteria bacterium]